MGSLLKWISCRLQQLSSVFMWLHSLQAKAWKRELQTLIFVYPNIEFDSYQKMVASLIQKRQEVRKLCARNLDQAQLRTEYHWDRWQTSERNFIQEADKVLLFYCTIPNGATGKLLKAERKPPLLSNFP